MIINGYKIEQIDVTNPPDSKRLLYRITKEGTEIPFYKGVRISGTREATDLNKQITLVNISDKGDKYISERILSGNESNEEILMTSSQDVWNNLDRDGSPLQGEKTNG